MDVSVKHKGVVRNGKPIFDMPQLFQSKVDSLEGKRFDLLMEPEHEKVTVSQWAYYYGGIIKGTCMKTEAFAGWTDKEINQAILNHLRTSIKIVLFKDGSESTMSYVDDLKQYSKTEMVLYIEDVLNFLAEKEIYPLPPDNYKYGVNLQIKK
jgi:hypothetical protein